MITTPARQPLGFDGDLTWCPGWARYDATTTNIEKGLLYPYNRAAGIYHCPGDHSSVETSGGRQLGLLRKRSYSLSAAINGQPTNPDFVTWPPNFQKETSERFWELIGETNTIIHHPPQERRQLGELLVR